MARATRDSKLETRAARAKLTAGQYHWRGISKGLALGYRRGRSGGTWTVRLQVDHNKYVTEALGKADDYRDANGLDVLDYFQAQRKAREFADNQAKQALGEPAAPYRTADAIRDYLDWYAAHRKALGRTRLSCEAHILPMLGERPVADLTAQEIRKWHEGIANAPARLCAKKGEAPKARQTNDRRARRASANRVLTILKAALNHAYHEGRAQSDDAWKRIRPFRGVDTPKVRYLSEAECVRLSNACAPDFRQWVQAALLTGCRYGELTGMRVSDFNPDAGMVLVRDPKNSHPRYVPLTDEGQCFFTRMTAGRRGDERLFLRQDGEPWGQSHQQRPLLKACEIAGVEPIGFHVLRHTYGSMLAMRGAPLQVIAEVLGHADTRMTHRHYVHLLPSYVADTIRAKLPSFGIEPDNVTPMRPQAARIQGSAGR